MSFDVLYFPNLSLPGPQWTNAVSLYFDRVGIIAPSEYELSLSDRRTASYVSEGIVKPMFAGAYDEHAGDEEFVAEIVRWWRAQTSRAVSARRKYRIHRGKIESARLLQLLDRNHLLQADPEDGSWLIGPEPVCMRVMARLAQQIVERESIAAVLTSQKTAFEYVAGRGMPVESDRDRRIRAVTSLLPIGPWVSAEQLARFKDDHRRQLRLFRGFVEQLVRRERDDESFEMRIQRAAELRDELVDELETIQGRSTSSGLWLSAGKYMASLLEASPISGMLDLISGSRSRSSDAQRGREIGRDGLAYAVMARSSLRARSSSEILA